MTLNNTMHATLYNSIQDYTTLYKAIRHHTTLYNVIQDYTTIYKAIQRAPYTFCVKRDGLILLSGETWSMIFLNRDSWWYGFQSFYLHVKERFDLTMTREWQVEICVIRESSVLWPFVWSAFQGINRLNTVCCCFLSTWCNVNLWNLVMDELHCQRAY
jgi:hypothetical protein